MHWKRFTHACVMGLGLSVVGAGCSAVNAVVSSPAGVGATSSSPDRLVAIGRVFENQGHTQRAMAMYRQAMKADPGNSIAQERLDFIAGIDSGRSFTPTERRTRAAIAAADSLRPATTNERRTTTRRNIRTRATGLESALSNKKVIASLQAPEPRKSISSQWVSAGYGDAKQSTVTTSQAVEATGEFAEAFADDAGWVQVVDSDWNLQQEDSQWTTAQSEADIAPDTEVTIETVAFSDEEDNRPTVQMVSIQPAQTTGNWEPAVSEAPIAVEPQAYGEAVSLDELSTWMGDPVGNAENLLRALRNGENEGVTALAATLLAECPEDTRIDSALAAACRQSSELIRLTARDAMVQRGAVTNPVVDDLLSLLTSNNGEIRVQAAASLRTMAGTAWSSRCVEGLARMLIEDQPQIVAVAASTLGDFGTEAQQHQASLEHLTQSTEPHIVEAAHSALTRITGQTRPRADGYLPVLQ